MHGPVWSIFCLSSLSSLPDVVPKQKSGAFYQPYLFVLRPAPAASQGRKNVPQQNQTFGGVSNGLAGRDFFSPITSELSMNIWKIENKEVATFFFF